MNIIEVYKKYKIPQNLQEHMLRVAAVADLIAENFTLPLARDDIVIAALLHDMGNIVKFDLDTNPLGHSVEEIERMRQVQREFIQRYGNDEHQATQQIINEIKVGQRTVEIADSIGFSRACEHMKGSDFEKKICAYADMRVSPTGVVSLQVRLQDGKERYKAHKGGKGRVFASGRSDEMQQCLEKMENELFAHTDLIPEDITDETIQEAYARLRSFVLNVS
jgi:predicted HD phosphohydrolase